ncbi:synaptic vesicle membrane protein VAT-1 homolog-like [Apis laboriosa]|uniref:Synaptic vesicle membrane protein VAT-1 homolog-like isoform X1 n=2 Tax=Apis TaxID=7459 RepID=A0A7M7H0J4_APIME|nr:synaptic vesicle membrane protein VAT-1 homolog-like isoform X1 [Apis mellifera]XP_006624957.1 synaptic vesicle membrane protein VAT-1 homolog-like [Apis dorsata]XP_012345997.1 synaptic vesicle membrane protein VAT-1 homolog-like [Apis florea]XP_016913543.1 synaptic vesicle membrane protein VAT-1 homolog-like [Apis cerana]XP_043792365.1 synaptic vesicle membrane protein VAT-1 homolog-like [Apis laboriosa]KAG6800657.1 synaptic vesicle membrane protein VAT-1-like isoform X1 [Apis mellifera ca|eukprot:XP_006570250.1 synaptic vesicle membrane protein VAT-1 homolog-like isoform X1 [Apis mellifera]
MAEDKNETSPSAEGEKPPQEAAPSKQEKEEPKENKEEEKKVEENGDGDKPKENGEEKPTPEPKDMRAIVLNGFGGLKSVKALRKPEPTLSEGEVLIRVKACGLNFQDLMARQGAIDSPPKTPFIMGSECAGDIEQVGEGVENFKVGDRVVALPDHKAWAELVAVPATSVFALPAGMSYLDAAAITMNYTVAYILLFELANLTPGKNLLLHSAGGGVGQAVVQLAKTVKDVTIFGVCSKSKHEALKATGTIDHILERGADYSNEVRKISPEGVDIVLDCLCGEECNKGYALLKPMGKYILYGSSNVVTGETKSFFSAARSWWQVDKVSPIKLFDENKTLSGLNLRHLMYQHGSHAFVRRAVERVFALWNEGKIKPVVDSTWALEDVPEAMQKMHDRKNIGKIVLDPSLEPKPKPATPAKGKTKDKKAASQESQEKKASSVESEEGEKKKEPELTNGTSEDKSDSDSKEKESS